jgi:hypothetical protein
LLVLILSRACPELGGGGGGGGGGGSGKDEWRPSSSRCIPKTSVLTSILLNLLCVRLRLGTIMGIAGTKKINE